MPLYLAFIKLLLYLECLSLLSDPFNLFSIHPLRLSLSISRKLCLTPFWIRFPPDSRHLLPAVRTIKLCACFLLSSFSTRTEVYSPTHLRPCTSLAPSRCSPWGCTPPSGKGEKVKNTPTVMDKSAAPRGTRLCGESGRGKTSFGLGRQKVKGSEV